MYTRPAIEITKVPRVYSAEGLALSREVALDIIMKAVERVEGPDPTMFVAKKSAPVTDSAPAAAPVATPAAAAAVAPALVTEEDNTPKVWMMQPRMFLNNNVVVNSSFNG